MNDPPHQSRWNEASPSGRGRWGHQAQTTRPVACTTACAPGAQMGPSTAVGRAGHNLAPRRQTPGQERARPAPAQACRSARQRSAPPVGSYLVTALSSASRSEAPNHPPSGNNWTRARTARMAPPRTPRRRPPHRRRRAPRASAPSSGPTKTGRHADPSCRARAGPRAPRGALRLSPPLSCVFSWPQGWRRPTPSGPSHAARAAAGGQGHAAAASLRGPSPIDAAHRAPRAPRAPDLYARPPALASPAIVSRWSHRPA